MSDFVYSKKPIEMAAGEGVRLIDESGTAYLDFGGSYACVPLGHDHDTVSSAVQEQLSELTFVQAVYPVKRRRQLYQTLADVAPGDLDNVWLCNSGTEANEAALKFARSGTDSTKIVATEMAFHGRTMGSLSTTWKDKYRKHYEPMLADVEFVPYNDPEAMREAVDEETAAVILEPIQGEGGINPASPAFLEAARSATHDVNAALIFDEIQTGLGRTGRMWDCQRTDVLPDMLTTAKGLGNGFPIGATLCRDWIAEDYGSHASTFGGNPVIAAAADATVSTIRDEDLSAHAGTVGQYLREQLETRLGDRVSDIRGEGLMIGIGLDRDVEPVLKTLATDHQILALSSGSHVLRLLPPLVIEQSHADELLEALGTVL